MPETATFLGPWYDLAFVVVAALNLTLIVLAFRSMLREGPGRRAGAALLVWSLAVLTVPILGPLSSLLAGRSPVAPSRT